jgi:hypothetical protein
VLFSSNDVALYRRDRITLQKGKEAVNSYSSATAQGMLQQAASITWAWKRNDSMPNNKRRGSRTFPHQKRRNSSFLKKNDFSLKNESIIEMAKFISTF